MKIVVYGEDGFRVQEKVKQMREAFLKKFDPSGMNLAEFPTEGTKFDPGVILQSACSLPFLGEKRMVIIRGLIEATKATDKKVWVEGFARVPDSTIVVFWETASAKTIEKKTIFKALSDDAELHTYSFDGLTGKQLDQWVVARITAMGGQIHQDALMELVGRVGPDLWHMDTEIRKLVAYGKDQPISREMVSILTRGSFEGQIFELMDAMSRKETRKALTLLETERRAGATDFYLLSMLIRQVRILLGARALLDEQPAISKQDVASVLGIHPFVASKALAQARRFSFETLRDVHTLLFEYDRGMKTGGIDPRLAVDLVSVQLVS